MTAARVGKDLLGSVTLTFGSRTEITLIRDRRVIDDGVITHVFYPVFPPDRSAQQVIDWLRG